MFKVNDVFTGSLRSMLVCQRCGCGRDQVEPFINVSLPLSRENTEGKITIQSCLDLFTKSEALADNVHCPSCNKNTESSQQHGFATLPEVLCLHLKRFDSLAQKKLTEHVSFPLHDLDMGKYLAQW
jgi:ubiquitin C-terminal hydrolase